MDDWHSFAYEGDEWLVAYACIPGGTIGPVLFTVGHAVELYMKAVHVKLFGDVTAAIDLRHNIKRLWDACKGHDSGFMSAYEIRDSIYSRDFLDRKISSKFTPDDEMHFGSNQSLYIIFKHLQDLKYFHLPWKKGKVGPMVYMHPDPFWISFFKDLRKYLDYPPKGKADRIAQILEHEVLPIGAAQYLRQLY